LIAFGVVWIVLMPFVLGQHGLAVLPLDLPDAAFIVLFIAGTLLGPTGGAFVVTGAIAGREGVRQLLRRYIQWRVGVQWYLLALFGPFVLYLIAAALAGGTQPLATFFANWSIFFSAYPAALVSMIVFPALVEEPGWRGFALPRLQFAYGPLRGTLLLGLLHGLWHLPVYFLVSGPAAMGPFDPARVATNTLSIMALTTIWTWVVNRANGSILIAILLHAASNASDSTFDQFIPVLPDGIRVTTFAVYVASAALVVIATRGRLGFRAASPQT
jgi:membrane protease YdiL (CAAX protease family)